MGRKQECIKACPYGVPEFDKGENYHQTPTAFDEIPSFELGRVWRRVANEAPIGRARKCTFCLHKQNKEGDYVDLPACAKTCMGKAIHFGNLNDPDSEVSRLVKTRKWMRLKEEAGTGPSVYYLI